MQKPTSLKQLLAPSRLQQVLDAKPVSSLTSTSLTLPTTPDIQCADCSNTGWVRACDAQGNELPVGHPSFGRIIRCPKCGPERQRLHSQKQWANTHIPAKLQKVSFGTYRAQEGISATQRQLCDRVEQWAQSLAYAMKSNDIPVNCWAYLTGEMGRGKSGLAVCALRTIMTEAQCGGVYVDMATFLAEVRDAMKPQDEHDPHDGPDAIVLRYSAAPVLIIDDLGAERLSKWSLPDVLWPILNKRYDENRPTIITSNLGIRDLYVSLADTPQCANAELIAGRIISRLQERCADNLFEFKGDVTADLRMKSRSRR